MKTQLVTLITLIATSLSAYATDPYRFGEEELAQKKEAVIAAFTPSQRSCDGWTAALIVERAQAGYMERGPNPVIVFEHVQGDDREMYRLSATLDRDYKIVTAIKLESLRYLKINNGTIDVPDIQWTYDRNQTGGCR